MGHSLTKSLLLASVPLALGSGSQAWADEQEQTNSSDPTRSGEIIVYGQRQSDVFAGVFADTELNENDIAAYGFDNIGDLLDEVVSEIDPMGEGPLVLINGQLTNGIKDIADLPTEAASRIQILPQVVSARLGQSPTRRVINIVVKPDLEQFTASARASLATRGDAFKGEGEVNLLRLENNNRRSLVLKAQRSDPLLESERNILPDSTGTPFDVGGNVVAAGSFGGEIDPVLSLLAGSTVLVAGVPTGVVSPSLAQFAALAGLPNLTGAGQFRTLIDERENYSANGNMTQRLNSKTVISMTAQVERSTGSGLSGLSSALLRLPATSPFSPFGRDVSLAVLLGDPLRRLQNSTAINLGETVNGQIGRFSVTASATLAHRVGHSRTDRDYDLGQIQAGILAGTINPFVPIDPSQLGPVRSSRARSRSDNGQLLVVSGGPLFNLPTGQVRLSMRADARLDRFSSSSRGGGLARSDSLSRDDIGAQANLQIPLLPFPGMKFGAVVADVSAEVRDVTSVGTLRNYGAGLNWQVSPRISLRGSFTDDEIAPVTSLLTDPVVISENFRVFDFIRQETVLVRYLTGGNPALPTPRRRTTGLSGTAYPFNDVNLSVNAEYTRVKLRNAIATLPPANAEVQAAFPDRFIRDANGVLVQLDARPISFGRDLSEQFHWGIDFRRVLGGPQSMGSGEEEGPSQPSLGRGWRVALRADHTWFLERSRQARPGLAVIDLLAGGALGYGGGQPRHLIDFSGAAYHRGVGLQLNGSWIGKSLINSGTVALPSSITFKQRTTLNARIFANLGPLFPETPALKGARVALEVSNLFDSKQRVVDQAGLTPRNYQPFLLDPLGRVINLSLRKVF